MTDSAVQHIAVIDKSGLDDRDVQLTVQAYRLEVERFCHVWKLPVPGLAVYPSTHEQAVDEEAALIFVDSGNEPDAFGWHTAFGVSVFGYVDVGLCRLYGEPPDRVFGHELFELVLDPECNLWMPRAGKNAYAKESSDPVQAYSRTKTVDDPVLGTGYVEIADYILPSWFEEDSQGPWSDQGHAPGPFLDAMGGYHLELRNGVVVGTWGARVKSFGRTFRRLVSNAAHD